MPEHDLSTQEYHTYWKAAWTDLGCKYKTRSRYYDITNTFSYIICKLVSVNSRKRALMCAYAAACYCMNFLKVELNLYTFKAFFSEKACYLIDTMHPFIL